MKHIKLGDLDVSCIGLGAMGMSHGYTDSGTDEEESIRTLHRALELGVTQGTIINVSSIAGQYSAPAPATTPRPSSRWKGCPTPTQGIGPLGIKVLVVEPSAFRKDFAGRSLQQSPTAIADYAEAAGLRRKENDTTHGHQPGDPARAPQVVFDALASQDAPFRLLLGSDAVAVIRDELATRTKEVDTWETASRTNDFPS